jgi:hypothetical protein
MRMSGRWLASSARACRAHAGRSCSPGRSGRPCAAALSPRSTSTSAASRMSACASKRKCQGCSAHWSAPGRPPSSSAAARVAAGRARCACRAPRSAPAAAAELLPWATKPMPWSSTARSRDSASSAGPCCPSAAVPAAGRRRQAHAAAFVDPLDGPQQVAEHRFAGVGEGADRPSISAMRIGSPVGVGDCASAGRKARANGSASRARRIDCMSGAKGEALEIAGVSRPRHPRNPPGACLTTPSSAPRRGG